LINGVLRNYLRQEKSTADVAEAEAHFNHPQWLIDRLRVDWPDRWQQIIAANNDRAPMWLRVNRHLASATGYKEEHELAGECLAGATGALRLEKPVPVEELPGFEEGVVSVQDGAAQLAAPWLLARGGGRVLDACAAPGGKTGHLLELLGPGCDLTAIDSDETRLEAVRQNLNRLGQSATVMLADASNPGEWWDGEPFGQILLDAPCSATGVIRRHPDIKILRRESDIQRLAARQLAILEALWGLLEPGGRLLYVTCSVLAEENDGVVGKFLASHDEAHEDRVLHDYNIRDLMQDKTSGFQVLPGTKGLDGFYFACLEKDSK
jgi:16S rRNA (cytosine967-C5)-methyltransferase